MSYGDQPTGSETPFGSVAQWLEQAPYKGLTLVQLRALSLLIVEGKQMEKDSTEKMRASEILDRHCILNLITGAGQSLSLHLKASGCQVSGYDRKGIALWRLTPDVIDATHTWISEKANEFRA